MTTAASENRFRTVRFAEHVDPATPPADEGALFLDTDGILKWIDDAGVVSNIALGSAGFANPMTTSGDIIYGGASGVATRLAKSTDGKVLTLASGIPSWATPAASGAVATDSIWDAAGDLAVGSGADTAAKLAIGAVGGHVSRINGVVAWDSGTSNPGSAVAGDRYWRSDLGQIIYYDGTRWLTEQMFTIHGTIAGAAANGAQEQYHAPDGGADWWLVDFGWTYNITPTHSGGNTWAVAFHKYEASGATDTTVTTLTSDASTTIWKNPAATAIGALLGTTIDLLYFTTVKTGSPSNLNAGWRLRYRKVIT